MREDLNGAKGGGHQQVALVVDTEVLEDRVRALTTVGSELRRRSRPSEN